MRLTKCFAVLLVLTGLSSSLFAQITKVPIEVDRGNIFITVTTGKSGPLRYVFDTGATNASIDSAAAVRSGMDMSKKEIIQAAGHNSTENYVMVMGQSIKIGSLELNNINPLINNFSGMTAATGMKLEGLIGYELLERYVTAINFDKKEMSFYKTIKDADTTGYTGIPFEFNKGVLIPRFPVTIKLETGETFTGRAMFDSGGGFSVLVSTPFNKFHKLSEKLPNKVVKHSRGISNITNEENAVIAGLSFGGFSLGKMAIDLTINDKAEPKDGYLGMIGIDVINRFNVIFDYANKKIYMKPNKNYGAPFKTALK